MSAFERTIVSLALISAVYIHAAEPTTVAGISQEYKASYDRALERFNKNDYKGAYKLFYELFERAPDDPKVNFYLGRCALEIKEYEEALLAFERVLIIEPTHIRSRLEMARAYFELKEFDSAEAEFDKVLEAELPKNVRNQIEGYKKAMDAAKRKHFLTGYLMAGIGWDSNINNGIGAKDYTIASPFGLLTLTGDKPKSDYYHTQIFGLNHIWNLSNKKDGLFWQDGFTAYAQSYPKSATSNARYFSLTVGPGYRAKSYELSIALATDYLMYGASSPYMQTYSAGPKGSYKLSDSLILEGSYTYKKKTYPKENKNRNSRYQEFYAGVRKLIPQSGSMLTFGFTVSQEREDEKGANSRTDVSNSVQKYSISLYQPLMEGLDLTSSVAYTKTDYDEMDVSFLKTQEDRTMVYGVGLMKSIGKSSMVTLNGTYTDNKSNIDNKIYNKKGVSLNYVYNF